MKWSRTIMLIRHGESAYNELKAKKEKSPLYQSFLIAFNKDPESEETIKLAGEVAENLTLDKGDNATPLTKKGELQAYKTGCALLNKNLMGEGGIVIPDAIFVSPHLRTRETLEMIQTGWPALGDIKTIEEVNLREQEHGMALIYNDWRVFHALKPEQRRLYKFEGPYWYRYPQGESVPNVQTRVKLWFDTITRDYAGENIMVVTHHLTILTIITMLERSGSLEFLRLDREEKPFNCGVTLFEFNTTNHKLEKSFYNLKLW